MNCLKTLLLLTILYLLSIDSSYASWKLCADVSSNTQAFVKSTQQRINVVFKEVFYKDGIYEPAYCRENIINLYREIKKQVPGVKSSDFNVLFIAPSLFFRSDMINNGYKFTARYARMQYNKKGLRNKHQNFDYHFVLEYQGLIYDLSYTDKPIVMTKKEYYETAILDFIEVAGKKNRLGREDLAVSPIPGERYLDRTTLQVDEASEILQAIRGVKLRSYEKYMVE